MSVLQILGASRAAVSDEGPLELLLGCHRRIRDFTALASRLASDEPAALADIADVARRVHRYHAVALPLHQEDEELSLASRLEHLVAAELAVMKREHVELDETLATLLPLWEQLAAEPGRRADLAVLMQPRVARMQELWTRHLSAEEAQIFPALARIDPAGIVEEMRARRLPR